MLSTFTAIYDACVLYPAALRSLLMYLALSDLFRARWTDQIHEEWIRNVLKNRPEVSAEKLTETRRLMNSHAKGSLVTGYEALIQALVLPDRDDRHVLAAAIHSHADVIVTYNTKDFPAEVLAPYQIEAQHPDIFLSHLFDLAPGVVFTVIQRQIRQLQNPPLSTEAFLAKLETLGLPQTVAHIRAYSSGCLN